jgi:lipopolysaccharide transport protein LptA
MEGKTATCDQAVYQTATQSLTLTGENTRIQSGDNYITGNTVTIYQETGQIIVDGNDTKRVNAVFQPDDKTMTTDFK